MPIARRLTGIAAGVPQIYSVKPWVGGNGLKRIYFNFADGNKGFIAPGKSPDKKFEQQAVSKAHQQAIAGWLIRGWPEEKDFPSFTQIWHRLASEVKPHGN